MQTLITIIHVIACIFLILVVLLQSGRGGGMGAAFAGASGQIFGGRGASSFLSRVTSAAAIVFFLTSLTLSMLSSRHRSVVMNMEPKPAQESTATDPNDTPDEAGATGTNDKAVKPVDPTDDGGTPAQKPDKPATVPAGAPNAPAP